MGAPDQSEDELENLLMAQKRPERPQNLKAARELVEGYVAEALKKDMSPPEARVEATRVVDWLGSFAREAERNTTVHSEPHRKIYGVKVSGMDRWDFVDSDPGNDVSTLLSSGQDDADLILVVDSSETEIEDGATIFVRWPSFGAVDRYDDLLEEAAENLGVKMEARPGWIFLLV